MSNRYIVHSRISEAKFREILRLFCADLQPTQIVTLSRISKTAINRLVDKIRKRIAVLAEKESCFSQGEIEIDESYFGPKRIRGKRGRGAFKKIRVFGMKKRGDKVYTQIVKNCSAADLLPIIKCNASEDSIIYSDEWKAYDGLVEAGYNRHYRVKHSDSVFSNGRVHINGIESFWSVAKTRLAKCRGILYDKFFLHLKETEFRFNHRSENLYALLLKEFRKNPL